MVSTSFCMFPLQSDILMDANQSAKMLADVIAQGERERDATALTILIEDEEEQQWPGGGGEEKEWHQQLLEERRRRRRQAQTGRNFPRNQWDPARPIPFVFDPKLSWHWHKWILHQVPNILLSQSK